MGWGMIVNSIVIFFVFSVIAPGISPTCSLLHMSNFTILCKSSYLALLPDDTLEEGDMDSPLPAAELEDILSLEELGLSLPPIPDIFLSDDKLFSQD